jgi:hypothetical protein
MVCAVSKVQAQTEDGAGNLVAAAAIMARLQSGSANGFALGVRSDPEKNTALSELDLRDNFFHLVGFRLKSSVSRRIYLAAKADIGGFGPGSGLSWQLFGGVGLNLGRRIFTVLGYRHLDVDYRKDGFVFDVALSGFVGGYGFRF